MLRAVRAYPPFDWVYGDDFEYRGIYPELIHHRPDGGTDRTMVDPKTIQEVDDDGTTD